jgi:hypothetical protein
MYDKVGYSGSPDPKQRDINSSIGKASDGIVA